MHIRADVCIRADMHVSVVINITENNDGIHTTHGSEHVHNTPHAQIKLIENRDDVHTSCIFTYVHSVPQSS